MTAGLQAQAPAALAAPVRLANVPFFAQAEYQCGPAALAMVLAADGADVSPEALVPQVYVPARAGALQAEMLATARRYRRLAVILPPRLDAMLTEVAAGRAVIVLQNLALPIAPRWHYAVVIGFDIAQQELTLHSGTTESLVMPLAVFERTWARSGYWAMVATPPEQLPVTPDASTLLTATTALERIDAGAAARSYAALVWRAPGLFGAWFGLGNARHAAGDLRGAEQAFERATQLEPLAADAWHNLALTQLALGRTDDARRAAEKAVTIGGARIDRYRQTLAAIDRAPGP